MSRHTSALWWAVAGVGLLAVPAAAQTNLLLNPSFEVPSEPDPGNGQLWIGDYATYSMPNGQGARVHYPTPGHVDGSYGWEISEGNGTAIVTQTYQTVAVSSGATVSFTGWAHTGPGGSGVVNTVTINVRDGGLDGAVIGTATVDETTPPTDPQGPTGDWVRVTISGQANSGAVTVEFTATVQGAAAPAAVHLDNFVLTSSVACGLQHTVANVNPDFGVQSSNTTGVSITGTNLNLVTAVKLVDDVERQPRILTGTITHATQTTLTVDLPTYGAPAGLYNMVTEQADCPPQVRVDGFEVLSANLLLNASFEAPSEPTPPGNSRIWFGDYATYSIPNAQGARSWVPSPEHVDGEYGWEISTGADRHDVALKQTVPVISGDTVTFTGYVHVGPDPDSVVANEATINVWDGAVGGVSIGSVKVDKTTPRTFGDPGSGWAVVTISGQAGSGAVTVQCRVLVSSDWGHAAAVHLDAFMLVASTTCATPLTLTSINPTEGPHNADTIGATVTGTGLTNAAVKLVQVDTETVLQGAVTGGSDTQLTVNLPTNGVPLGLYNVLAERPSCVTQVLVDGFEVVCANPTAFTGMDPAALNSPQGVVQFTITGVNLNLLATVALQIGDTEIAGSIVGTPTSTQMTATFDLTNANLGPYNLVGTRSDLCAAPALLLGAFTLLKPGDEKLLNGDFDDYGPKGTDAPLLPAENWDRVGGAGPTPKYNASTHTPTPPGGNTLPGGVDGSPNRGSVDEGTGGTSTARIFQSAVVTPSREVTFTGYLAGGSFRSDYLHRVILWDGGPDGTELARFTLNGNSNWATFSLVGTPTQPTAAVEWGHAPGSSGWNIITTHVDELSLIQSGCNAPFADSDKDTDVDQDDFALFQICYTGTNGGVPPAPAYCGCFDKDGDTDIDQADFLAFSDCSSGPMIAADPGCGG